VQKQQEREKRERVEGPQSSRFELPATSASQTATKKSFCLPEIESFFGPEMRNSIKFHAVKEAGAGGIIQKCRL
jgi:hypothetical protein